MRNNQDRLGATEVPQTSPEPAPAMAQQGADFSFVAANDIVELPSGGEFYPEDHPLRKNPTVEVRQMTAKEEDILLNQSYIKQGTVVEKLLHSLIVTKNFDLDDLLVGDKNAILTQIRRSAYGDEYPVEAVCRSCMKKAEVTFDLEECVRNKPLTLSEGVEATGKGTFTFTAPKTKAKIEIRFLTGKDEKALADKEKKYKKHNVDFSASLETYRLVIVSVNDNPALVGSYIENMPLRDAKKLKEVMKDIQPGVEMKGDFVCPSCDTEVEMDLPINFRFLWPDI
jgi:hypothetical protein